MTAIVRTVGCAFILIFLTILLRELGFRGARLLTLIGAIGIIAAAVMTLESVFQSFEKITQDAEKYAVVVMKIIGVGYVSGVCSDVCIESGEITLSNAVLFFGKAEMLLLSAPFAISIVEKGVGILQ